MIGLPSSWNHVLNFLEEVMFVVMVVMVVTDGRTNL
jgi:hypothetical protein